MRKKIWKRISLVWYSLIYKGSYETQVFGRLYGFSYACWVIFENVSDNIDDIEHRDDKKEWHEAVNEKMECLLQNGTWILIDLTKGKRAISNKHIFKIKRDKYGNVARYKARLVVKDCSQWKGLDYQDVYAPIARLTAIRTLLSVINNNNYYASQMDVKMCFCMETWTKNYIWKTLGFCRQFRSCMQTEKIALWTGADPTGLECTFWRMHWASRFWEIKIPCVFKCVKIQIRNVFSDFIGMILL